MRDEFVQPAFARSNVEQLTCIVIPSKSKNNFIVEER